ncbi:retrovirus-related Pol polyprotein from transposon TNT 1-94 [Trichonephila clavipes]|nr:retrovirus-related Pol polyprotein from transposon TNT 1-94 [Trichonephila clavipes]
MGGFITFIDETPISSRTFKQKSVSLSTMEAEYVSVTEAAKEFIWLKNVIDNKSLNLELSENVMFCDNQAAISYSKSPVENCRTKHIDVRYHFLRNLIYDKVSKKGYSILVSAQQVLAGYAKIFVHAKIYCIWIFFYPIIVLAKAEAVEVDMSLPRNQRQYKTLSQFERGRIIGMMEAGLSARSIAHQVDCSHLTVRRCWDQRKEEISFTRRRPRQ